MHASVLVAGGDNLERAMAPDGFSGRSLEAIRSSGFDDVIELGTQRAPDLLLIDASRTGATEVVEQWIEHFGDIPIVALSPASNPERVSVLRALGVSRILPRSVAHVSLRRACEEVLEQRDRRTVHLSLGRKPTVAELGDRLAAEVRRALVDDASFAARDTRLSIADEAEVIGAMWGAIARVQEVVRAPGAKVRSAIVCPDRTGPSPLLQLFTMQRPERASVAVEGRIFPVSIFAGSESLSRTMTRR